MGLRAAWANTAKLEEPGARGRHQLSRKPALSPHPPRQRPRAPRAGAGGGGRAHSCADPDGEAAPARAPEPRRLASARVLRPGPRPAPGPRHPVSAGARTVFLPPAPPPRPGPFAPHLFGATSERQPRASPPLAPSAHPSLAQPSSSGLPAWVSWGLAFGNANPCSATRTLLPPALLFSSSSPLRESRCQSRCSWGESPAASGSSKYRQAEGERE